MKKRFLLPLIAVIFTTLVFAGWNIIFTANVAPGSCTETDAGLDWGVQGTNTGLVTGINNSTTTNGTQYVSFTDYCQGNILQEGVCGSNYGYPSLAGLLSLNCSSLNTPSLQYSCLNGACVPQPPTNNTNSSLPDLTVNLTINNVINLSSNNTNSTSNIQFLINYTRTIKNIGNAASFAVGGIAGESMVCTSGGGGGGGGPISVPPLSPNQVVVQTLVSNVNCYGTWTATAIVDNTNALPESNENNNNVTITRII